MSERINTSAIQDFINEQCLTGKDKECGPHELFRAYQANCEEAGEVPLSRHNFMTFILRECIATVSRRRAEPGVMLHGVALKE